MDHMMPEMDGIEATAAIRKLGEKFSKMPIIALTANAVQGAKEMFLANGFSDFISKPIEMHVMNEMLSTWLPPEKITHTTESETDDEKADTDEVMGFMSALDSISEINTRIGISRVSGVETMYHSALAFFTRKVVSECKQMSSFIESRDVDSFAIRVHAMKSKLSTIGAIKLSETAARLELAAKNKDIEYCSEHYPSYHAELLALHKKLLDVFPDEEKINNKKAGDAAYLNEHLQKALAAADNLDHDTSVKIFGDLLSYNFGDSVNTELKNAMMAVEEFDFDKVMEILRRIASS